MKCSIMQTESTTSGAVLWSWVQNVSGDLDTCIERLNNYQDNAKHGQKYILVEELPTTTSMLNSAKLITELTLVWPKNELSSYWLNGEFAVNLW